MKYQQYRYLFKKAFDLTRKKPMLTMTYLYMLFHWHDKKDTAKITLKQLMDMTGYPKTTLHTYVKELASMGVIKIVSGEKKCIEYSVTIYNFEENSIGTESEQKSERYLERSTEQRKNNNNSNKTVTNDVPKNEVGDLFELGNQNELKNRIGTNDPCSCIEGNKRNKNKINTIPEKSISDEIFSDTDVIKNPTRQKKQPVETTPIWEAYKTAYHRRYGIDPVRNAQVNSCVKKIKDAVGIEDGVKIVTEYLKQEDRYYISTGHPIRSVIRDIDKLRILVTPKSSCGTQREVLNKKLYGEKHDPTKLARDIDFETPF